jgi:hypothetical protein
MPTKVFRTIEAILRFYCGRKGAAVGRMMISFCAAVLFIGVGLVAYVGPQIVNAVVAWSDDMKDSINKMHDELYVLKIQNAARDEREKRLNNTESDVQALIKEVNDHERRIYRLEGAK